MTQEEYERLYGQGYKGAYGSEERDLTEEGFATHLYQETQARGGMFTETEVKEMYASYFNLGQTAQVTTSPYDGVTPSSEVKAGQYASGIDVGEVYENYVARTQEYDPTIISATEYEAKISESQSAEEETAIRERWTGEVAGDVVEGDITVGDEYSTSMEDAEMLTKLKEQAIIEQLLMGQKGAMTSGLALEEMQQKYGISGGMALAQETQRQAQISASQQPLYGALSMLPYEQELLERELSSAKSAEEREATSAFYEEQFSQASLDELLLKIEMQKLYLGGDE